MAHFRWFHHGIDTAIGEMANPRELFLLTQCDDAQLDCIYRKINVTCKRSNDFPDFQNGTGVMELGLADNANEFFYRFHYNEYSKQFTDVSFHEKRTRNPAPYAPQSECCERLDDIARSQRTRIIGDPSDNGSNEEFKAFHKQGVDYYLNDFVYIFDYSFKPYR